MGILPQALDQELHIALCISGDGYIVFCLYFCQTVHPVETEAKMPSSIVFLWSALNVAGI